MNTKISQFSRSAPTGEGIQPVRSGTDWRTVPLRTRSAPPCNPNHSDCTADSLPHQCVLRKVIAHCCETRRRAWYETTPSPGCTAATHAFSVGSMEMTPCRLAAGSATRLSVRGQFRRPLLQSSTASWPPSQARQPCRSTRSAPRRSPSLTGCRLRTRH